MEVNNFMIIDGKKIAQEIIEGLKTRPAPKKILAAVLVGLADSSQMAQSASFLKKKEEIAKELGVDFRLYGFEKEIKNDELRDKVGKLANQKSVGGVIVQLPLPEHLNKYYIPAANPRESKMRQPFYVLNAIPREKDVDVLGERALGAFYAGRNPVLPPAVATIEQILLTTNYQSLTTSSVAVIGRGLLVGKPAVIWLLDKVAELSVFNSQTENLKGKLKDFDIIVSGAGKANLFSTDDMKENALVIDFGYDFNPPAGGVKMRGDFNFLNAKPSTLNAINYTPTPGGTGPILVAKLFENFYELNKEK